MLKLLLVLLDLELGQVGYDNYVRFLLMDINNKGQNGKYAGWNKARQFLELTFMPSILKQSILNNF